MYQYQYQILFCTFSGSLPPVANFLAVPVAGRARAPPLHYGTLFGLGQAPWRVLWVSELVRDGSFQGMVHRVT